MLARSYQTECVFHLWEYFRLQGADAGNPLCVLPTGTGKSVCIALFLESIYKQFLNQKVLVLTHVKELIEQNYKKLLAVWKGAPAGIYSSGLNRRDTQQKIIFAGIASVVRNIAAFGKVDLVVVDECHLISPNDKTMYQKVFDQLRVTNPYLKIIGFTATDYRLGQGKLTEGDEPIFTDVVFDISHVEAFNRLIAEGYLSPLIPRPMTTYLSTDGVHMRGGEYNEKELQAAVNKDEITRAAIEEALAYKDSRQCWLVFASGTEHSDRVAELLNDYGISAVSIHSKMKGSRDEALKGLRQGKYQAVVNNNILTTGFDHPPIDLILVLRPTQSAGLWVQMLGRGTRPYDPANPGDIDPSIFTKFKENCLVLDYARNSKRLGPINDPVIPRPKGKGGGEAPIKECDGCGNYCHASVRFCGGKAKDDPLFDPAMGCGTEFQFQVKIQATAGTDEIIKGDLPVVETFKVSHISYERYKKMDRPDSVKVTYYCGLQKFTDYVCIEHPPQHGGGAAKRWLKERILGDLPSTTDQVLAMAQHIDAATHIRVWVNKKYPQIMSYCFNGTAFGKEDEITPRPTVDCSEVDTLPIRHVGPDSYSDQELEDDIPF